MRLLTNNIKIICKYSPREEIYCFLTLDVKWWKWEFKTIYLKIENFVNKNEKSNFKN